MGGSPIAWQFANSSLGESKTSRGKRGSIGVGRLVHREAFIIVQKSRIKSSTVLTKAASLTLLVLLASGVAAQVPPPDHTSALGGVLHAPGMLSPFANACTDCHGQRLGGASARSCFVCHSNYSLNGVKPSEWTIPGFTPPSIPFHNTNKDGYLHAEDKENPYAGHCTDCHGPTLYGGIGPSCYQCHEEKWTDSGPASPPADHDIVFNGAWHKAGLYDPFANSCTDCHGADLEDVFSFVPACYSCHDEAAGTEHDFASRPWLDPTERACMPCHDWATWNHDLSPTLGYTVSDRVLALDLADPTGASAKCLGCHEGNVAVDSYLGKTGTEFVTGGAAFGTDLTHHHPVSFTYDTALAIVHGGLNDPSTTGSGLPGGGTIAASMLDATGQVQCTSCHNPHENTLGMFLWKPANGLCFTCHTRDLPAGTRGLHHIPLRDDPWLRGQCTLCHGANLDGVGGPGPACTACHAPFSFPDAPTSPAHHGGDRFRPYQECAPCHGDNLEGASFGTITTPSCSDCHADVWDSANQPPVVDTGGPYAVDINQATVVLDASATVDPEGDSLTFDWDFGDGGKSRVPSPSATVAHTYTANGTFNGALSVTDGYNPPVVVPFVVDVTGNLPVGDVWRVTTSDGATFSITIEDHDGALVVLKDDGVNPTSLGFGAEMAGVIFWMDIWIDFSGGTIWGVGSTYFGNINRATGAMAGITFDGNGSVATFSGQEL